ncbi:MAG: Lrp/AsnC family transcriptional regulator [Pseudomonadota bacterium]|jgi:Lrp/AsnC family leucine-responsive transcriptional regulator|nr:Lrp/AsnC family transcriptional regulator [Burkholderiales bacterium]MCA3253876.1 Lrp/AsnC family transcriptional regulator [Rubrivivax sp.]MCA3260037.1 Lrp/AsnC family transcriptional regulator [Rubrivivax sp.]MCZ8032853.1 Lrp/AsnC family transcriptional regulator [Rubrivivax sp.]
MLDKTSRRIVACLQRDATLSVQQLADAVGLSPTPVWRRLKALQESGVLRARVTLVDREKLGLSICVLAHVTLMRHGEGVVEAFERMVATCAEIMECASTTGESDYLIKVVVADMKAYDRFLQERLLRQPGVASVRSSVVLREVKYETALPV